MSAQDTYPDGGLQVLNPAIGAFDVTPSDADELAIVTRQLVIGGAGDVHVLFIDGSEVTYTKAADSVISGRIRKVFATGTTATKIIGEY